MYKGEKHKCKSHILGIYKKTLTVFSILLFILSIILITFIINKYTSTNKIKKLNENIANLENKNKEMKEQLNSFQGYLISYEAEYNDTYAKIREESREKYNLTKYQKRYDYFNNPVEDETQAFTIGFNSEYGNRYIFPKTHQGTDLQVIGKIINPADGIVYKIGENLDAGKYCVMYYNIQGREHLIAFYHCNQLLVKKGDTVKQDEPIAKYGNTGNSSNPHNHFALYTKINGVWYSENFYMNSFHKRWSDIRYIAWRFVYEEL